MTDEKLNHNKIFEIISVQIQACSGGVPSAVVTIKHNDIEKTDASIGDGAMDAIFKTIDRITGYSGVLKDYKVQAVSQGKDALAKVTCQVIFNEQNPAMIGHGLNIDTMVASARAYVGALNSYLSMDGKLQKNESHQI